MSFVIGCLGAVIVLGLFCGGMYVGWCVRTYFEERIDEKVEDLRPAAPVLPQLTDEQMTRMREDQEAFETMLHYSPEQAYGLKTDPLQSLMRNKE